MPDRKENEALQILVRFRYAVTKAKPVYITAICSIHDDDDLLKERCIKSAFAERAALQ